MQHEYAHHFARFPFLAMLHLNGCASRRRLPHYAPLPAFSGLLSDEWAADAWHIATALPSLDFVGWHGEHYVVVRCLGMGVELRELPTRRRLHCAKCVDLGSDDAAWMERKDIPIDYDMSSSEG